MKAGIILIDHPRLDFRDCRKRVLDFQFARFEHAGFERPQIAEGRDAVAGLAQQLTSKFEFLVVVDALNPIQDVELIRAMLRKVEVSDFFACIPEGAVPGTQPEIVLRLNSSGMDSWSSLDTSSEGVLRLRWETQAQYNNQFNLYKYKRLKMFLGLWDLVPELPQLSLAECIRTLERQDVFEAAMSYFEPVELRSYENCPSCGGSLTALAPKMSQPFLGYLPASRPYYFECEDCRLIVLSPSPTTNSVPQLYDAFDAQDFVASVNNPYVESNPRCNLAAVRSLLPEKAKSIDLGGGMGRFSQFLKRAYPKWQVVHSDFARFEDSALLAEDIESRALNFLAENIGAEEFDLVTAWEVVEHIPFENLGAVFSNVHQALRTGGLFRFSTPDFDSPLCQAYDFFNACPPFHLTVLSSYWLRNYFAKDSRWKLIEMKSNSDFLDDAVNWFDYAKRTSPEFQVRAVSAVLSEIFRSPHAPALTKELLAKNMGTEVIVTLQKQ